MGNGFRRDGSELKIEAAVKRLTPSAKRGDIHAFAEGIRRLRDRYGREVADEATLRVLKEFPEVCNKTVDLIQELSDGNWVKQEIYAQSVDIMASILEDVGLRLEDSIRVTDAGIALTKKAVAAIAATGFPEIESLGLGNDNLEGMGISRKNGFIHPLSKQIARSVENGLPEDCLNLWALISLVISGAQGWIEADREKCVDLLREAVAVAAPTIDLQLILKRSRYDDRALLRLCGLAHDGMEGKVNTALGL